MKSGNNRKSHGCDLREVQLDWLRQALRKTGLNRNELAVRAQINPATLYKFNVGTITRMRQSTIDRIARVAKMTPPSRWIDDPKQDQYEIISGAASAGFAEGSGTSSISVNAEIYDQARQLGLNIRLAAETGIADAVRRAREDEWRRESKAAIDAYNERIEREGPILTPYWADAEDD